MGAALCCSCFAAICIKGDFADHCMPVPTLMTVYLRLTLVIIFSLMLSSVVTINDVSDENITAMSYANTEIDDLGCTDQYS